RFMRFQNRLRIITGPNAAPNPAHAFATKPRMVLLGFQASTMATSETNKTEIRPIVTNSLSLAFRRRKALYKSSVNELEVTRSCDEIVLIIAARMAANKIPVING